MRSGYFGRAGGQFQLVLEGLLNGGYLTSSKATVYTFSSSDGGTTYKYASGVENGFTGVSGSTATSTVRFLGITKAGFSDYTSLVDGAVNTTTFVACNSGATFSTVVAADTPSGGTVSLTSALVYHVS